MGRIIALANQKGGVGKTTTAINLAASLAACTRRVLLVDLDPQGNATTGSGVNKNALENSSYEVLTGRCGVAEAVVAGSMPRLCVLAANGDLTAAEVELMNLAQRESRLRVALTKVPDDYDFILIDCPPALNMLTVNALVAAQSVLIPMQCEYYALEGLTALLNTIEKVRETHNAELQIEGLLRTMFDPRNNLASEVSAELDRHFGDKVYRTVIPRNIRLAEAPSYGLPVLAYDKSSRGALAYLALAGEILAKDSQAAFNADMIDEALTGTDLKKAMQSGS